MSNLNRREFLRNTLVNLVQVAGSVTLASAAVARTPSPETQPGGDDAGRAAQDLQQRADQLAASYGPDPDAAPGEQAQLDLVQLRRSPGFRNGGPGSFRNRGAWRPSPWRNGGWRNGGWRNVPWRNGGWPNGFWSNVPWRNGNWINAGFQF